MWIGLVLLFLAVAVALITGSADWLFGPAVTLIVVGLLVELVLRFAVRP